MPTTTNKFILPPTVCSSPTTSALRQQPQFATDNLGLPPTTSACHQQPRLATSNLCMPQTTSAPCRQPHLAADNLCLLRTTFAPHQQPLLAAKNLCPCICLSPTTSAERPCKALSTAVSRELIYSRYISLTSSPSSNENVRGLTKPKSVGRFGALSPFFPPTLRRSKTLY